MTQAKIIELRRDYSSVHTSVDNSRLNSLPASYIEVGVATLPKSERIVRFYLVKGVEVCREHYRTIVKLYQKTYGSQFQPVPDVSKWVIALDDRTGVCLGSIAITSLHDSAAPFILHGTPKGKSVELVKDLARHVDDEHGIELRASEHDCEAGTFTVNSDELGTSYDILNLARLILWEIALHAKANGHTNSVFVATRRVRLLLTRIGVWFWPFRPASVVFRNEACTLEKICARMRSELQFPEEAVNLVLEKYAEISKEETHKIHDVRAGLVHIPQMIEQLGSTATVRGFVRRYTEETRNFDLLVKESESTSVDKLL